MTSAARLRSSRKSAYAASRNWSFTRPDYALLLERILAQEEEHANDMHDLLVSHEGRPMPDK